MLIAPGEEEPVTRKEFMEARNLAEMVFKWVKGPVITKEEEIEKTKKEEKSRMAKQMLADKMPLELIVKYSGLSEAEITNL